MLYSKRHCTPKCSSPARNIPHGFCGMRTHTHVRKRALWQKCVCRTHFLRYFHIALVLLTMCIFTFIRSAPLSAGVEYLHAEWSELSAKRQVTRDTAVSASPACTVFNARTDSLRQNIHSLLHLSQTVRLERFLIAPGAGFKACERDSMSEVAARFITALRRAGYFVKLALSAEELESACLDDASKSDLLDKDEYTPYDLLLCFSFYNCGTNLDRATFRGLAVPIDSTSFNPDTRFSQSNDQHPRDHIITHQLFKQYMHIIFGISSAQTVVWKSLVGVSNNQLARLHMIRNSTRIVEESARRYTVLHAALPEMKSEYDKFRRHGAIRSPYATNTSPSISNIRRNSLPRSIYRRRKFVFGFLGGYSGPRKGIQQIIDAFKLAFPAATDFAELHLYLTGLANLKKESWPPGLLQASRDPRIKCIPYSLKDDRNLHAIYQSMDVYVSMSQFEGFGMTPLEAMAHGVTLIVHSWSGHLDYCFKPACFSVRSAFLREDPQWPNDGIWAVADVYDAAEKLKNVFDLHMSGQLPHAAEHIRTCIINKFRAEDIVQRVLGSDALSIKYNFIGCFETHVGHGDVTLLEADITIQPEACWRLARQNNFRFFALSEPTGDQCVGISSLHSRHDKWSSPGYYRPVAGDSSSFVTQYTCSWYEQRIFEVRLAFPRNTYVRSPQSRGNMGQFIASAMRPGMVEASRAWFHETSGYEHVFSSVNQCSRSRTNLFLNHFTTSDQEAILAHYHRFLSSSSNISNFVRQMHTVESWDLYDLYFPAIGSSAMDVSTYGMKGKTDQGKLLVNTADLTKDACNIFSAGSNNVFDFEVEILGRTNCTVYVFDCTVKSPSIPDSRINYYEWCLGKRDTVESGSLANLKGAHEVRIRSLQSVMRELSISNIDILKMDIEGSEWGVLNDLLSCAKEDKCSLPSQLAMELHFDNSIPSIDYISALSYDLHCAGYVVVAVAPNEQCAGCAEISFARLMKW